MLEGVVAGVIHAAAVALIAIAQVNRGDAEVVKKGRKVGARSQRLDREILVRIGGDFGLGLDVLPGFGLERIDAHFRAQPLSNRNAGLGVDYIGGHFVDQMLEVVTAADTQKAAPIAIGVDIEDRLALQFAGVRLHPFGRAQ